MPKIVCWQIWLERNQRIFRNKRQNIKIVIVKIKCQLKESLGDQLEDSNLNQQELDWGAKMGLKFSESVRQSKPPLEWQIRSNEKDFSIWSSKKSRPSLFFDGVAKGNPGKAGDGGVIKNIEGRINTISPGDWATTQACK